MQETIRATDAFRIQSQAEIAWLQAAESEQRKQLEALRRDISHSVNSACDVLSLTFRDAHMKLGEDARTQISDQADRFGTQIHDLRRSVKDISFRASEASETVDRLASDFSKAVTALLGNETQEEKRAKQTVEELDKLIEKLRALQPAGETLSALISIEGMRQSAANCISTGDFQAALIITQGSIMTASRALINAIVQRERSDAELEKIHDGFSSLQSRVRQLASKEGSLSYKIGEETFECAYDVDYWSHGLFGEISKQTDELGDRIQKAGKTTATPEFLRDLALRVETLGLRLEACDMEARQDLAGTLALENTVQKLYFGLEERGWTIDSSGHQDDDVRKPYAMTCTDSAGNVISIVGAGGERPETPSFFYEAFADNVGMAALVKESVAATLQTEGIDIESDIERSDCASISSPDDFIKQVSRETKQLSALRREKVRKAVESAQ